MNKKYLQGFFFGLASLLILGASLPSVDLVKIISPDETKQVDVITISGRNLLETNTNVSSINVPFGKDPIPDAHFKFLTAGQIGDTVSITIAGTTNDTTTPDDDLDSIDYQYTLVAEDVGNERKLAVNFAMGLNSHASATAAFIEADAITGDKRAIVHISSEEFSLTGEFHERPNSGDVAIATTGTTTFQIDSEQEKLISRAKETSLGRDPSNPHRLGVQSISGQVRIQGSQVDQLFFADALNGGSNSLTVNGATTSVTFSIPAKAVGENDIFIEQCKLFGTDTNIKVQDKFLGLNSPLANGLLVQFTQEGTTTSLPLLKNTGDILARFASTASDNKIINQAGGDFIQAVFDLISKNVILKLENGTDDSIQIFVQDNISAVADLFLSCEGFEEEP